MSDQAVIADSKSNAGIIIGLVVCVCVMILCCIGGYFVYTKFIKKSGAPAGNNNQCASNRDCSGGRKCVARRCHPADYCEANSHCTIEGQICEQNKCIYESDCETCGECYKDDDCGNDQLCIDKTCTDVQCKAPSDCEGEPCLRGKCQYKDCINDNSCNNPDQKCLDGKCRVRDLEIVTAGQPPYQNILETKGEIAFTYTCPFKGRLRKLSSWVSGCQGSQGNTCGSGSNHPGLHRIRLRISKTGGGFLFDENVNMENFIANRVFNFNFPVNAGDVLTIVFSTMSTQNRLFRFEKGSNGQPRMLLYFEKET